MIDLLGHLAYSLLFVGILLLGRRNRVGWVFCAAGNCIWVCLGFGLGMTSIVLWDILFIAQNIKGWANWSKQP